MKNGTKKISLFGCGKTMQALGKILAPCDIYDDKFTRESSDEWGNRLLPPSAFCAEDSALEIISPGIAPSWEPAKKAKNLMSDYDFFYATREVLSEAFGGNLGGFWSGESEGESGRGESKNSESRGGVDSRRLDSADFADSRPQDSRDSVVSQDSRVSLDSHRDFPHFPRLDSRPAPFSVWISGTNGKTTTTQMTQTLLEIFSSEMGGNIGRPLCELPKSAAMWILETSSFTLHYTNRAHCDIYALLPITLDHISWHGSFEAYEAAKLKALSLMGENSAAILPQTYAAYPQIRAFQGRAYFYESAESLAEILGIQREKLRFKGAFLLDAIMALAIAKLALNLVARFALNPAENLANDALFYEKINAFAIDAHKIEEFRDRSGRLFVDDSKATNIDATLEALKIYRECRIFLILGGDAKGVDLSPLIAALRGYDVRVFSIGRSGGEIAKLCANLGVECESCGDLKTALEAIDRAFERPKNGGGGGKCGKNVGGENGEIRGKIQDSRTAELCGESSLESRGESSGESHAKNAEKNAAKKQSVCLLSPACASLDQFSSYKERGEIFKKYALGL